MNQKRGQAVDRLNLEHRPSAKLRRLCEFYSRELVMGNQNKPTTQQYLTSIERYASEYFYLTSNQNSQDLQLRRLVKEGNFKVEKLVKQLRKKIPHIDDAAMQRIVQLESEIGFENDLYQDILPIFLTRALFTFNWQRGEELKLPMDILEPFELVLDQSYRVHQFAYDEEQDIDLWVKDVMSDLTYLVKKIRSISASDKSKNVSWMKPSICDNGSLIPARHETIKYMLHGLAESFDVVSRFKNGKINLNKTFELNDKSGSYNRKLIKRAMGESCLTDENLKLKHMPYKALDSLVGGCFLKNRAALSCIQLIHIVQWDMVRLGISADRIVSIFDDANNEILFDKK